MTESRIAGVATIPGREAALADVLERIAPQVNEIYVACNNYGDQDWHPAQDLSAKFDHKVVFRFPDHPDYTKNLPPLAFEVGRQDNNKATMLGVNSSPGYRFPLDDDILHPPTLIEDSIRAIEEYGRKCVVSWGGKRYDKHPIKSYYRSMSVALHALHDQMYDFPIHIPLSGAMSWHTDLITFDTEKWVHPLMADLWAGLECLEKGVPIMALAHKKGYLVHSEKIDLTTTIWETEHLRDKIQTGLVNRQWPALQWPT